MVTVCFINDYRFSSMTFLSVTESIILFVGVNVWHYLTIKNKIMRSIPETPDECLEDPDHLEGCGPTSNGLECADAPMLDKEEDGDVDVEMDSISVEVPPLFDPDDGSGGEGGDASSLVSLETMTSMDSDNEYSFCQEEQEHPSVLEDLDDTENVTGEDDFECIAEKQEGGPPVKRYRVAEPSVYPLDNEPVIDVDDNGNITFPDSDDPEEDPGPALDAHAEDAVHSHLGSESHNT